MAPLWLLSAGPIQAEDWRQWRGPTGDHHAPAGAVAPVRWSDSAGTDWVTPLPGRGHSSPTLVGGRIYLTTGDAAADTQSLLVLDRQSGELLVETVAHRGGLNKRLHRNNTHASPTVASDGERVFAVFGNSRAAWATAFDLDGRQLWQTRVSAYDPQEYEFGYGTSPVLVGDQLVVMSEYDGAGSSMTALDTATGDEVWRTLRPQKLSYSPPARYGGPDGLLLVSGNYRVAAYSAASGRELWNTPGPWQATCNTMVWDPGSRLAFASGGYPAQRTMAVRLDGDHGVAWQQNVKCYEQSLSVVDGYLYGVSDRGVAYCWRCTDGAEMWRQRLGRGGSFSSSLVLVAGNLYATSEAGTTFVFQAAPSGYQPVAENQLGDEAFATPTPADGRLYHRFGRGRQQFLAAIGG
ncbi:MAG: PQQ-binding-like beta-propeller repeat protein [Planctomycetota bacterium]